jgi:hypothetical protein
LAAEAISGDRDKAVAGVQEPLAAFVGKTALELVAEDRTDDLLGTCSRSNPATSVDLLVHDEHVTSVARSSATEVMHGRKIDELRHERKGDDAL